MIDREKILARVLMLNADSVILISDVGILQTLLVHVIRDAQELAKCVEAQAPNGDFQNLTYPSEGF